MAAYTSPGLNLIGDPVGRPIKNTTLSALIRNAAKKAGLPSICVPHGLRKALAHALAAVVIGGILTVPLFRFASFLADPFRNRFVKWRRFIIRGSLAVAALFALFATPLHPNATPRKPGHSARRMVPPPSEGIGDGDR